MLGHFLKKIDLTSSANTLTMKSKNMAKRASMILRFIEIKKLQKYSTTYLFHIVIWVLVLNTDKGQHLQVSIISKYCSDTEQHVFFSFFLFYKPLKFDDEARFCEAISKFLNYGCACLA